MKKDSRRLPLAAWQLEDSDRLRSIFKRKRAELKLTQEKLAAELGDGVTQGAVSHFMNGRTALSIQAATVFARMLQVPIAEFSPTLAGRIGDMATSLKVSDGYEVYATGGPHLVEGPTPKAANQDYTSVPRFSARAAAGNGHDNPHVEVGKSLAFRTDWLRAKGLSLKNLQVIQADGHSMWPTISDGDAFLVDTAQIDPVHEGVFVLQSATEGTVVKRLIRAPEDNWIVRSDNPDKSLYEDRYFLRIEFNEQRIIGRVVWRGGDI
jgi:SOS-response transcriptional repressor LexA